MANKRLKKKRLSNQNRDSKRQAKKTLNKRLEQERQEQKKKDEYIKKNGLSSYSPFSIWTKKKVSKIDKVTNQLSWEELEKAKKKVDKDKKEQKRIKDLLNAGYDISEIKQKMVRSDKETKRLVELKAGSHGIDWDKERTFDGRVVTFAFRDLTGEMSLGAIIRDYMNMPIKDLLKSLELIVNKPKTYNRTLNKKSGGAEGSSSGKASEIKFISGSKNYVEKKFKRYQFDATQAHVQRQNALQKKRKYKTKSQRPFRQYTTINNGCIEKMSLRKLISIATAMLNNCIEDDRDLFYIDFYDFITEIEPELIGIIPKV